MLRLNKLEVLHKPDEVLKICESPETRRIQSCAKGVRGDRFAEAIPDSPPVPKH